MRRERKRNKKRRVLLELQILTGSFKDSFLIWSFSEKLYVVATGTEEEYVEIGAVLLEEGPANLLVTFDLLQVEE